MRHIRALAGEPPLTDAELLGRFVRVRDDAAFAELVARHGPLVLGVARRWLADKDEADDVVQTTFLALSRQAKKLDRRKPLSGWLYTVAFRLARKAQARASRRDRPVVSCGDSPDPLADITGRELMRALDEELAKLPERYRAPLLLCHLDGLTRDEAAGRLGLNLGAIRGRLERGRELLRKRLEVRGLTLPIALAGVLVADGSTALSAQFVAAVTHAALTVTTGATMSGMKLTAVAAALLVMLGTGAGLALREDEKPKAPANKTPVTDAPGSARVDAFGDPLPEGAVARLGTTRFRPGHAIEALAFSPDGKKLACWGGSHFSKGRLTIWEVPSGRLVRQIEMPNVRIKLLAWLPDGRGVAIVKTARNSIKAWEFTNKEAPVPQVANALNEGALHGDFLAMAISPDGRYLATGRVARKNQASPIEIHELAFDKPIGDLPARKLGEQNGHGIALVFTRDGRELLAASRTQDADRDVPSGSFGIMVMPGKLSAEARLVSYNVETGRVVSDFKLRSPSTLDAGFAASRQDRHSMALTPESSSLIVGGENGDVSVWDWRNGRKLKSFMAHPATDPIHDHGGVVGLALDSGGKTLVTAGFSGRLKRWELATVKQLESAASNGLWTETMAASHDGKWFAAGGPSNQIVVEPFHADTSAPKRHGHEGDVEAIQVMNDGKTALTAGTDGLVIRWDLAAGRGLNRLTLDAPIAFWPSAFVGDGLMLGGNAPMGRRAKYLFDLSSGKRMPLATVFQVETNAIFGSPRAGAALLLDRREEELSIREWPSGSLRHKLPMPDPEPPGKNLKINSGTLSADGQLAASIGEDERDGLRGYGYVNLWNAKTGAAVHRWLSSDAIYHHVSISPDNSCVVVAGQPMETGGHMQSLVSFDIRSGELLQRFVPPGVDRSRNVRMIAISPDSKLLAAAENDNVISVYDLLSGKTRGTFAGHSGEVRSLAFTSDSGRLISASADQTCLVWPVAR